MNNNYLTAIIICPNTSHRGGFPIARKYHDIRNTETKLQKFMQFAAADHRAKYVNFYFKCTNPSEKGRNFAFRRYIERLS